MHAERGKETHQQKLLVHQQEKIAEVAEKELNEYVVNSPSYIRDTTDFINQIKDINGLPDDTILFCFDVCKLYPSIPKKEDMDACEEAVAARSSKGIGRK